MFRQYLVTVALAASGVIPSAGFASVGLGQIETTQPPQRATEAQRQDDKRPEPRRWMWWRVAETKAQLGITEPQAGEIDQIFQAAMPSLREAKDELDRLDSEVAQVIKASTADDATVSRLVERAEHTRARLTATRTVMLYRMHRVLSAEQREKLNAMFERWEAQRRKSTDSNPRR